MQTKATVTWRPHGWAAAHELAYPTGGVGPAGAVGNAVGVGLGVGVREAEAVAVDDTEALAVTLALAVGDGVGVGVGCSLSQAINSTVAITGTARRRIGCIQKKTLPGASVFPHESVSGRARAYAFRTDSVALTPSRSPRNAVASSGGWPSVIVRARVSPAMVSWCASNASMSARSPA